MMTSHPNDSPIDALLLSQGFVRREDLEKAHGIREDKLKRAELSMGLILVKEAMISKEDLNRLLRHPQALESIKSLILERGWMNEQEIETWEKERRQGVHLKRMVEEGILSQERAGTLIRDAMDHVSFLKLALKEQMIDGKDLENVLSMKRYNKSVSQILLDENLVSLSELNYVYRKCDEALKLGTILVLQNLLTDDDIDRALAEQKEGNATLGQILIRKGLISLSQLYFALSIQYNTPFRELRGFVFNEKQEVELRDIVGQTYVREHHIIPLFLNENNLTLAVSNPGRIVRMHELMAEHRHLNMTCVLITQEKFEQLYAMLYGEMLKREARRSSETPASLFDKDGTWVITDPKSQSWLISNLYEGYLALGAPPPENGKDLFFEFIRTSFDSICTTYGCGSVSFWFETEEGTPVIKASPVLRPEGP